MGRRRGGRSFRLRRGFLRTVSRFCLQQFTVLFDEDALKGCRQQHVGRKREDVGLGYIKLGQSSSTLSGGENQRVKLAFYLSQEKADPTLFIFDEPTTGLHFHDIRKLLDAFDALIRRGHSIVIIEHNMDVIKCADYVIDLGPEGGDKGGNIVAVGTPEEVAACGASYTGQFLKEKLK